MATLRLRCAALLRCVISCIISGCVAPALGCLLGGRAGSGALSSLLIHSLIHTTHIHNTHTHLPTHKTLTKHPQVVNERLSPNCKARLTVENDDRPNLFSVRDLLLVHELSGIPIVCDMHHWQFCKGDQTQEEALRAAVATWPAGVCCALGGWRVVQARWWVKVVVCCLFGLRATICCQRCSLTHRLPAPCCLCCHT